MDLPPLPIELEHDHWVLTEDFEHLGWDGKVRVIPKGFETDLASLPWFLGWLFPRFDENRARAAIPHDYFYRLQTVSRMAADRMMFRDLILHNSIVHQAIFIYVGLRWFGWWGWKKNKKHAETMRAKWDTTQERET